MVKRVKHPPAPPPERPDTRVRRPRKHVAPSQPNILRDTFTAVARTATAHLIAGASIVGFAAKKIKDVAEPMLGEARHTYQRMRLDHLRRDAQGLPDAFSARLDQLAPDLEKYETGLNQDAIGRDLDEAAYLIGEYKMLGRLPQVAGLADDVSEKYQAAWAKAVGAADHKALMQIGERHQILVHVDRLHGYTEKLQLPKSINDRLDLIMGHVGELDLNNPLGGDETQTQTLAAVENSADLVQLYEMTQQEKEFHRVAGAERVAKNNADWVIDQFENHYEDLWDPKTTQVLSAHASHRGRTILSAATLARGHFLTEATRDKMLAALEDKHATTVIRYVEEVLTPQERANTMMQALQQMSGFRDTFQLEYKVPGFGIVPVEVMNDNPLSKMYLSWKNSANPNDRKMASRAATAMDWFIDPSRDTRHAAEEIALKSDADWEVFERRITFEARELGALETLMGRAADSVPKAKPSAMDQLIAFKARANQALGVGGRKPGHVTDQQLMLDKYDIDTDMLRYIEKNYFDYIPRAAARQRLDLFNDESMPLENRRAAATVYEAYLMQQVRNEYRVELQQMVGSTDGTLLDRALDIGRMIPRGTHYGYSDFKSIAHLQEGHQRTMDQIAPLLHLRQLNETAAQLKEMRETIKEYGGPKSASGKVEYALYGWVAERYKNAAPEHIGSLLFEIEKARYDLEHGDSGRSQWITGVTTNGHAMKEIMALHDEATEVIAYRDTAQDIIIMAAATAATAGVGASLGLAMTGGRWATTAGRFLSTGLRIAGRQATFLHVNALGKQLLRGKQDLYDFNKGWRYNAYNLGVQVAEFELMGRFHTGFKNVWKVAEDKLPSTLTLLKAALDPQNKLKDIAKALGSKLVTFNHGVGRDALFFHGWGPLGATVRGVAHGDLSEVRASFEELGSGKAFRQTLVFTIGMGVPLGHPLSAHAVKFALKHHLPEMSQVAARQKRIAAIDNQLRGLRDPAKIAQLRHRQFQLAEYNAATMERLSERFTESNELRQQWQVLHSAHLMARFNYANARQVELRQRVQALEAEHAPVAKRIQALKKLEAHAQERAVLTAMIHGNGELSPEAVMATELEATHIRLQRDHAETTARIARLERQLIAADISAPVPANHVSRLLQALRHQVQVMEEINALEPGRFTAEVIAAAEQSIAALQNAMPPVEGAERIAMDEIFATATELHDVLVLALGAQAAIVRGIAEAEAGAGTGKSEKSRLDPFGAARNFVRVWREATAADGRLRGEITDILRSHARSALRGPVPPREVAVEHSGVPWMEHFLTHATEAAREIFAAIRRNWSEVQKQDDAALAQTISDNPQKAANAIVADMANILSWVELLSFAIEEPTDVELQNEIRQGATRLTIILESLKLLPREIRTSNQIHFEDPVTAFLRSICEGTGRTQKLRAALTHIDILTRDADRPTHYIEALDRALPIQTPQELSAPQPATVPTTAPARLATAERDQILAMKPKDLKQLLVAKEKAGELDAFAQVVAADPALLAQFSYWEKWFPEKHRKVIDAAAAKMGWALAGDEAALPLDLEKRFTPDELRLLIINTRIHQLTFGCSKACPFCAADAVPGVRDEIPIQRFRNLIRLFGPSIAESGHHASTLLYFASEPGDYSRIQEAYHLMATHGIETSLITRETGSRWLDFISRRKGHYRISTDRMTPDEIEALKRRGLSAYPVPPHSRGVGVSFGTVTELESHRVAEQFHCATGVVITPRGIYNFLRVPISEDYPQGVMVVPIEKVGAPEIKTGMHIRELLRAGAIVPIEGIRSTPKEFVMLNLGGTVYAVALNEALQVTAFDTFTHLQKPNPQRIVEGLEPAEAKRLLDVVNHHTMNRRFESQTVFDASEYYKRRNDPHVIVINKSGVIRCNGQRFYPKSEEQREIMLALREKWGEVSDLTPEEFAARTKILKIDGMALNGPNNDFERAFFIDPEVAASLLGDTYPAAPKKAIDLPGLPPPLEGAGKVAKYSGAPFVEKLLRDAFSAIAARVGEIFDRLPFARTADFDAREAARAGRLPELRPWVRLHMFDAKAIYHFKTAASRLAHNYRNRLNATHDPDALKELHGQWQRESAIFGEIVELMMQQAHTPDERRLIQAASDHLTKGEFAIVHTLLEAQRGITQTIESAAARALSAEPISPELAGLPVHYLKDPLHTAEALHTQFAQPAHKSSRGIQTLVHYTLLVKTGKIPESELREGAYALAQTLANGYASDQSPIAPHTLLIYAHRLLGLSERDLTRDNRAQAKVWEDEAFAGLMKLVPEKEVVEPEPEEDEIGFDAPRAAEETQPRLNERVLPNLPEVLPPLDNTVEKRMQFAPDVRPVVQWMAKGALDLLSRTPRGRAIADHPWVQSAARALGLEMPALPHYGSLHARGQWSPTITTGGPLNIDDIDANQRGQLHRFATAGTPAEIVKVIGLPNPKDIAAQLKRHGLSDIEARRMLHHTLLALYLGTPFSRAQMIFDPSDPVGHYTGSFNNFYPIETFDARTEIAAVIHQLHTMDALKAAGYPPTEAGQFISFVRNYCKGSGPEVFEHLPAIIAIHHQVGHSTVRAEETIENIMELANASTPAVLEHFPAAFRKLQDMGVGGKDAIHYLHKLIETAKGGSGEVLKHLPITLDYLMHHQPNLAAAQKYILKITANTGHASAIIVQELPIIVEVFIQAGFSTKEALAKIADVTASSNTHATRAFLLLKKMTPPSRDMLTAATRIISALSKHNRRVVFGQWDTLAQTLSTRHAMPEAITAYFTLLGDIFVRQPTMGFTIMEGITEGIEAGVLPTRTVPDTIAMARYIDKTHGFIPIIYSDYVARGDVVLAELEQHAHRIIEDAAGPNDLMAIVNAHEERGWDYLLAVIQLTSPTSGSSFIPKKNHIALLKQMMSAGDLRDHVPEVWRKRVEQIDVQTGGWFLKSGQKLDPKDKVATLLDRLATHADISIKDVVSALRRYVAAQTPTEKTATLEDARRYLYAAAGASGSTVERIQKIQDLGVTHQSLSLLKEFLTDKEMFPTILNKMMAKIPDADFLRGHSYRAMREDASGLAVSLIKLGGNPELDDAGLAEAIASVLRNYTPKDIQERLLPRVRQMTDHSGVIRAIEAHLANPVASMRRAAAYVILDDAITLVQGELGKFAQRNSGNIRIGIRPVKGPAFGLNGLTTGVCTADDMESWKNPNYSLLAMTDETTHQVVGYADVLVVDDNGRRHVVLLGLNPSAEFMDGVDAHDLYTKFMEKAALLAKDAGYDSLLIPVDSNINSNRPPINREIIAAGYPPHTLSQSIHWHHNQVYDFQDVYLAWERGKPGPHTSVTKPGEASAGPTVRQQTELQHAQQPQQHQQTSVGELLLDSLPPNLLRDVMDNNLHNMSVVNDLVREGITDPARFADAMRLLVAIEQKGKMATILQLTTMGYQPHTAALMERALSKTLLAYRGIDVGALLSLSDADVHHALKAAEYQEGRFNVEIYRSYARLIRLSTQAGMPLTVDQVSGLAQLKADEQIPIIIKASLGAVDLPMAIDASLHQLDTIRQLKPEGYVYVDEPVARVTLKDRYLLLLARGRYDAATGMQFTLYDKASLREIATVGFIETDRGIFITRYQGGAADETLEKIIREFQRTTGGVAPLPWLSVITGQLLLARAQARGKTLGFITGERVLNGYPHLHGEEAPHIHTLQDARGPWRPPEVEALVAEYQALLKERDQLETIPDDQKGQTQHYRAEAVRERLKKLQQLVDMVPHERRTQKLYDAAARNLRFDLASGDEPFHLYHQGAMDMGRGIRPTDDTDHAKRFDFSLEAATDAMRADPLFGKWLNTNTEVQQQKPKVQQQVATPERNSTTILGAAGDTAHQMEGIPEKTIQDFETASGNQTVALQTPISLADQTTIQKQLWNLFTPGNALSEGTETTRRPIGIRVRHAHLSPPYHKSPEFLRLLSTNLRTAGVRYETPILKHTVPGAGFRYDPHSLNLIQQPVDLITFSFRTDQEFRKFTEVVRRTERDSGIVLLAATADGPAMGATPERLDTDLITVLNNHSLYPDKIREALGENHIEDIGFQAAAAMQQAIVHSDGFVRTPFDPNFDAIDIIKHISAYDIVAISEGYVVDFEGVKIDHDTHHLVIPLKKTDTIARGNIMLRRSLNAIFERKGFLSQNIPTTEGVGRYIRGITEKDYAQTVTMCEAILKQRARELGVPRDRVRVAVIGPGTELLQVHIWQVLGASVVAAESSPLAMNTLKDAIDLHNNPSWQKKYLGGMPPASYPGKVDYVKDAADLDPESADIVVSIHPEGIPIKLLSDALKPGGILIVQSDIAEYQDLAKSTAVTPLLYTNVDKRNFFMPSVQLIIQPTSKLLIARSEEPWFIATDLKSDALGFIKKYQAIYTDPAIGLLVEKASQERRVAVATAMATMDPVRVAKNFRIYKITNETDRITVAMIIAKRLGRKTYLYLDAFGITNKEALAAIAKIADRKQPQLDTLPDLPPQREAITKPNPEEHHAMTMLGGAALMANVPTGIQDLVAHTFDLLDRYPVEFLGTELAVVATLVSASYFLARKMAKRKIAQSLSDYHEASAAARHYKPSPEFQSTLMHFFAEPNRPLNLIDNLMSFAASRKDAYDRYINSDPRRTHPNNPSMNRENYTRDMLAHFQHEGYQKGIVYDWWQDGVFYHGGQLESPSHRYEGRFYLAVKKGLFETGDDAEDHPIAAELFSQMRGISHKMDAHGGAIQFKVAADYDRLYDADAAVIYFHAKDQEFVYQQVAELSKKGLLRDSIPHFTTQVLGPNGEPLPGVGFGECPYVHSTFGSDRANVINPLVDQIYGAITRGWKPTENAVLYMMEQAFREAGIDPKSLAFYINPKNGISDRTGKFKFIADHSAAVRYAQ